MDVAGDVLEVFVRKTEKRRSGLKFFIYVGDCPEQVGKAVMLQQAGVLEQRQQVGQNLAGMEQIRQAVDDRHARPPGELLEEARTRIYTTPDRYVRYVYGEHEVGGTSWMYITDIPFEIDGINVVLVDDVLYTGRTSRAVPRETTSGMSAFTVGRLDHMR